MAKCFSQDSTNKHAGVSIGTLFCRQKVLNGKLIFCLNFLEIDMEKSLKTVLCVDVICFKIQSAETLPYGM